MFSAGYSFLMKTHSLAGVSRVTNCQDGNNLLLWPVDGREILKV